MKKVQIIMLFFIAILFVHMEVYAEENNGEQIHLSVFVPYAEANVDSVARGFVAAIEQAEKAFPEYVIDVEYLNVETYKTKLRIYAAANELPDVFFCWSDGFIKPFLNNQQILKLNSYLPDDVNASDDRYEAFAEGGDIFGLAMTYWYGVFYCNKDLFEQYGLSLPQTWEELISDVKVFCENDIIPIACGLKDSWPAHLYVNELLLQMVGREEYKKYADGVEACPYETMYTVGSNIEKLINVGAFQFESGLVNYDDACRMFARGETAMYFGSSVDAGTIEAIADADQIEVIQMPTISECKFSDATLGKVSNGLCIAASTKHPDEAYELADFLAVHTAANSKIISPWTSYDLFSDFSLENKIRTLVEKCEEFGNNYDVLLEDNAKQQFLDVTVLLFKGDITVEDFAERMTQILNQQ